jgi:hypothetical protein
MMPSIVPCPCLLLLVALALIAWNNNDPSSSLSFTSSAEAAAAGVVDVGAAVTPSNSKPRGVIALDSKNFDSSLRADGGKVWLIEFYAPW